MILTFKNEKTVYKCITLAILAFTVFFACRIFYAGILALPYPKELLEPSNIALTRLFMEGESPYSLSALRRTPPAVNFDYPFLNSLLAAGIAKITGSSPVTAHFAVSLVCILASAVIGFVIVAGYSKTTVAPSLASLLFMFCHWRFGYISAAPDDLGLCLMMLTMLAAVSGYVKHKPFWCAVGITLCFYTKQYFAAVLVGIFIYMFLYSKREALKLLIWIAVINAAVAFAVSLAWPLYWTYSMFFMYVGAVTGAGNGLLNFLEQMKYLIVSFAVLFAVLAVAAAQFIKKVFGTRKSPGSIRIEENDAYSFFAVQIPVMLIPLFILGRNDGAFISYFLQLWMPSIVVVTLVWIEKKKDLVKENIFISAYIAVAAFSMYFGFGKLPLHIITPAEQATWEKALSYIESYGEQGDIFYSRSLSFEAFDNDNGECVCGHDAEVLGSHTRELIGNSEAIQEVFPNALAISDNNIRHHDIISEKTASGQYALITFEEPGLYSTLTDEVCENSGYECIDRLDLQLGNMPYEVAFYARR